MTITGIQDLIVRYLNESCLDLLVPVLQALTHGQCAMFGMVCWSLWNRRDKWVWNRVNGFAFGVWFAVMSLLSEWNST